MKIYVNKSTGFIYSKVVDPEAPVYPGCIVVDLPPALEPAFNRGESFHYPDWTPLPRPGYAKRLIEERWTHVRTRRRNLLLATDFTQATDSPFDPATKVAWATYRQALRDVTRQPDPAAIEWPNPPDASVIAYVPALQVL